MTDHKEHGQRRRILANVFSKSLSRSSHLQNVSREILIERMIHGALRTDASGNVLVQDLRALHGSFTMDSLTAFALTPAHSTHFLGQPNKLPEFQSWVARSRSDSPRAAQDGKQNLETWCLSMCKAYRANFDNDPSSTTTECPAGALYNAGVRDEQVAAELLDHFSTIRFLPWPGRYADRPPQ